MALLKNISDFDLKVIIRNSFSDGYFYQNIVKLFICRLLFFIKMISGHVHYIVILISNAVSFVSYIL